MTGKVFVAVDHFAVEFLPPLVQTRVHVLCKASRLVGFVESFEHIRHVDCRLERTFHLLPKTAQRRFHVFDSFLKLKVAGVEKFQNVLLHQFGALLFAGRREDSAQGGHLSLEHIDSFVVAAIEKTGHTVDQILNVFDQLADHLLRAASSKGLQNLLDEVPQGVAGRGRGRIHDFHVRLSLRLSTASIQNGVHKTTSGTSGSRLASRSAFLVLAFLILAFQSRVGCEG